MYILVPFIVFWNKTFNNVNLQMQKIFYLKNHIAIHVASHFKTYWLDLISKERKNKIMQYISKVYVYDRVQYIIEGT